jgi:cytochrome c553
MTRFIPNSGFAFFWSAAIHRPFLLLFQNSQTKESGDESPHSKTGPKKAAMNRRTPKKDVPFAWSVLLAVVVSPLLPVAAEDKPADPAGIDFFEKKVRPILVESCHKCHSAAAGKKRGGLLLDSRDALLKGGDTGPVVVPGHPEKSRLVEAVSYRDTDLRMPPRGKLSDQAIADLTAWVAMGAPWPPDQPATAASKETFDLQKRKAEHWAWQPVRAPILPEVKQKDWPHSPSDRFILAKLEANGLSPAPAADRRTLLRRVYFDLVGLPPRAEEVEAFISDAAPDALAKVVDRLLASVHYGERWGRHWLDLVRYAESRGHEFDYAIPNAYQYRDYVIRAFNADVPYNQFVTEHLAGDLLGGPGAGASGLSVRLHPTAGFNESLLGTGFWFLGEEVHSPVDVRQDQADRIDNKIDVLGKTFLGLTIACARCHDHKFDAISTKDYYALFGFLESSSYRLARFDSLPHNRRVADDLDKLRDRARAAVLKALAEDVRPVAEHVADYLLAAREALGAGAKSGAGGVEEVARARKLDAALLGKWTAHLLAAARDTPDPLHAWAVVATDAGSGEPKRLAETLKPLVEEGRRQDSDIAESLKGAEVVVDYTKPAPGWLPDGVGFGPRPVRPGDVRLTGDAGRPAVKLIEEAAAEKDSFWDGLKLAPGVENDPGLLGVVVRAGRTLRTPSFTLTGGKVFYLVRGSGIAYAGVGQHVMIAGPLHAHLVSSLSAGAGFRWLMQDLTAYKGLRLHVEFTAQPGADFAVAMVVQANNAPRPLDRPNQTLLRLLGGTEAASVETLAAGYQRLFTDLAERLAANRLEGTDQARLASWLLQHADLFGGGKRVAEAASPLLAEQVKLAGQIQSESRLAPAMLDGSAVDEHVFLRGSHKTPGPLVPRRFLEALAEPAPLTNSPGSGRLELARQMTDPRTNPFIARVLVNRVWHHLFGRGIVGSVDNFGVLGEMPTHPELLDYLADRFVKEGWSIKKLVRELVLSSAYQMSSHPDEKADLLDPQNLLLHRMRVRRLEGEAIRDAVLAISGRLDERPFGRSVPVHLTEFQEGRGRPSSGPLDGDGRRSVYLAVRRNFLSPLLLAFDTPIPFSTVGKRTVSNVPAQALILLNDPLAHQQAEVWARRVLAQGGSARERITGMYLSAFGRPPSDDEVAACLAFLDQQATAGGGRPSPGADDPGGWKDLAHTLFNVKEFIFLN